jgi:hypothetical protein
MISNKEIVIISTMDYFDLPTRKQRIALKLSENNRVLYFEPPRTYLSFFSKQRRRTNKMVNNNLYIFPLPTILPFGLRFKLINKINSIKLEKYIQRLLDDHSFKNFILWLYLIDYPLLYKKLNSSFIIYDCVDDHSSYGGLRSKKFVNRCEEEISKICNIVFATTETLRDKLLEFNQETYLVTNGVDYNFFRNYDTLNKNIEFPKVTKPIIGYIGAIKSWFDFEAINFASDTYKNYSFVIVGPCDDRIKKKFTKDNLFFLGPKSYENAPFYINKFDICLIPFIINDLTLSVSPLKFYEYCALGKPIVTSPIKQVINYSSICYIYNNKEEFIEKINLALNEKDINLVNNRIQIAKDNSWDTKLSYMIDKISEKLPIQ